MREPRTISGSMRTWPMSTAAARIRSDDAAGYLGVVLLSWTPEMARHGEAVSLLDSAKVRLTHNYVLAELVALCNARGLDRGVTLGFVTELTDDPGINIVWVGQKDHRSAVELLAAAS